MEKIKCIRCGISITMEVVPEDLCEEEEMCNKCYDEWEAEKVEDDFLKECLK